MKTKALNNFPERKCMRKKIITVICSLLLVFQSAPAFGQEITGDYSDAYGYNAETNGKTDVSVWAVCDGDVSTIFVSIKRKNADWSEPITIGESICTNSTNIGIMDNAKIYLFWQGANGIMFSTNTSAKSNTFKPAAMLPKSSGFSGVFQNWTHTSGNRFTYVAAVEEGDDYKAYSWDLDGNKWTRKLIADLLPASDFVQCDFYQTEVCNPVLSGMYLAGNSKGQISIAFAVVLTTVENDVQTQKGLMKVFERKSTNQKWVKKGTISNYIQSPHTYSDFFPSSMAVSPKGKTVIAFTKAFEFGMSHVYLATSSGFGKPFQFKDESTLTNQFSNQDGFVTFKGETAYTMFTSKDDMDAQPTVYFGKVGDLSSAVVVAQEINCTGFGLVGGKFKALMTNFDEPKADSFLVYTKGVVGWSQKEIVQSTDPNYGPLSWSTWGFETHGKLLVRALGVFDDGNSSRFGEGFYIEVIG